MTLLERGRRALLAARLVVAGPLLGLERWTYLQSSWALVEARFVSRRFRLRRRAGSALAGWHASTAANHAVTPENEAAVLRAFSRAVATSVVGTPCLARSIALAKVLRRHGTEARVEVGMRRAGNGWEGHAWVESAGRVIGDEGTFVSSFVRFERAA